MKKFTDAQIAQFERRAMAPLEAKRRKKRWKIAIAKRNQEREEATRQA